MAAGATERHLIRFAGDDQVTAVADVRHAVGPAQRGNRFADAGPTTVRAHVFDDVDIERLHDAIVGDGDTRFVDGSDPWLSPETRFSTRSSMNLTGR
jgi:hypothetical protein